MNYYQSELDSIKKANRYRTREVNDHSLIDFASNDYLGLSSNKELHYKTSQELLKHNTMSPKASMLVNGYHQIHKDFETTLCGVNGFEDGVVLGSGFNANIALIEALVRKNDELFMDELYHASGILATKIESKNTHFFKHNNIDELEVLLKNSKAYRKIVAIEGIYSMDGDIAKKEIFELCDRYNAILIVDEAHSSGVIGERLMGVFDHYNISIKPNHIKMGTLGKAYGSFGAYILASKHIIEYLINRAKPIIYATSLSLYDTLLAHNALQFILQNATYLKEQIAIRQLIVKEELGINIDALIVKILVKNNQKALDIKESLGTLGYSIGAIRTPTVPQAIVRLIARVGSSSENLREVCRIINSARS